MLRSILVSSAVIVTLLTVNVQADVFSVDEGSISPLDPAALLNPGPGVYVTSALLGLQAGDDLDALSAGLDIVTLNDVIYFSVDGASIGAPLTGVATQASLPDQAGDIYVTVSQPVNGMGVMTSPQGDNALVYDDDDSPAPGFGILGGNQDNLDAYSQDEFDFTTYWAGHDVQVYFSLATNSTSLGGPNNYSAADILVSNPNSGAFVLYKNAASMGLDDIGNDLDALALEILDLSQWGGPVIEEAYFSLAPKSQALAGLDGQFGTPDDLSAADVFYTNFNGTFTVAYTAAQLGLLEDDNVDALETNAVPEPATMVLLGLGGLGMLLKRKRR